MHIRIALSPDASILAVNPYERRLQVFSVPQGHEVRNLAWPHRPFDQGDYSGGMAFSPDGKYFAIVLDDGRVVLFEATRWRDVAGMTALLIRC